MALRRQTDTNRTRADLLVVGLGNPGVEYEQTRHNVGVWVVDELTRRHDGRLRRARREQVLVDELRVDGARIVVAVPTTYMNESGRAVSPLVRRYGIDDLDRLVIVHDELDLAVGRMKIKHGGGLAGHNGLKSVRSHLRADGFVRVRIGVGRPDSTPVGGSYVLKRPGKAERVELDAVVQRAADAIEHLAGADVESTMNRFNAAT